MSRNAKLSYGLTGTGKMTIETAVRLDANLRI